MSEQQPQPQTAQPAPAKKPSRWSRLFDALSTAIGEAMFGGSR